MYFRQDVPSVQILTNDTGMLLRCRRHEVSAAVLESWLLHPETDHRDKQINVLNSEISRLQIKDASLSAILQDEEGNEAHSVLGQLRVLLEPNR
jgi:hypothetical protein